MLFLSLKTEQMHVLDVRPGITDPASIKFCNENELMEKAENPEKYYIEVIMQEKNPSVYGVCGEAGVLV